MWDINGYQVTASDCHSVTRCWQPLLVRRRTSPDGRVVGANPVATDGAGDCATCLVDQWRMILAAHIGLILGSYSHVVASPLLRVILSYLRQQRSNSSLPQHSCVRTSRSKSWWWQWLAQKWHWLVVDPHIPPFWQALCSWFLRLNYKK